ncbi:RadC family protein [Haloferula rosea]|nr:DNA repair protein RadC [Haloferula rosea]
MSELMRDLPDDEKPREKLARHGPGHLDHAELLALFLGTGMKGKSAIQLGRDILRHFGSLHALGSADLEELMSCPGLGPAKSCQLAAAFEMGARLAREQISATPLDSPERIHQAFGPQLAHLAHEKLIVAMVNTRLEHVHTTTVSSGVLTETTAHPREILQPVILRKAYGFVLIHNHPSGDPTPSQADRTFTRRLQEGAELLGLRFVDHIVIGRPAPGREPYHSFREHGLL